MGWGGGGKHGWGVGVGRGAGASGKDSGHENEVCILDPVPIRAGPTDNGRDLLSGVWGWGCEWEWGWRLHGGERRMVGGGGGDGGVGKRGVAECTRKRKVPGSDPDMKFPGSNPDMRRNHGVWCEVMTR